MLRAKNICLFTGKLIQYNTKIVGDGSYIIGSGKLLLPDQTNEFIGQIINITAWDETATRLEHISINTWIEVLTVYTPNEFRGKLNDIFTVDSFKIVYE